MSEDEAGLAELGQAVAAMMDVLHYVNDVMHSLAIRGFEVSIMTSCTRGHHDVMSDSLDHNGWQHNALSTRPPRPEPERPMH